MMDGGRVSKAADVYSYGILLWEIVTGEFPFEGQTTFQVIKGLSAGDRPVIPSGTDPGYAALIQECWNQDPTKRPTFLQILTKLEPIFENAKKSMLSSSAPAIEISSAHERKKRTDKSKDPPKKGGKETYQSSPIPAGSSSSTGGRRKSITEKEKEKEKEIQPKMRQRKSVLGEEEVNSKDRLDTVGSKKGLYRTAPATSSNSKSKKEEKGHIRSKSTDQCKKLRYGDRIRSAGDSETPGNDAEDQEYSDGEEQDDLVHVIPKAYMKKEREEKEKDGRSKEKERDRDRDRDRERDRERDRDRGERDRDRDEREKEKDRERERERERDNRDQRDYYNNNNSTTKEKEKSPRPSSSSKEEEKPAYSGKRMLLGKSRPSNAKESPISPPTIARHDTGYLEDLFNL